MNVTIRIYPVGSGLLLPSEQNQIAAWHDSEFSNLPVSKQFEWTVGGHFNVLLDVTGEFAGFVGLMKREVTFDGQQKLIAGVRGLVIDQKWRRLGLGTAIMAEAHKVIFRTLNADYGFLLCPKELVRFYTSLGWRQIESHVMVTSWNQKVRWNESAMVLVNNSENASIDFKEIDLNGPAF